MKKIIVLGLGIFLISGCLVRTYTIYKPRVHTKITGNRGYIVGKPPKEAEKHNKNKPSLGKMRPITVIEVELGPHRNLNKSHKSTAGLPSGTIIPRKKRSKAATEELSANTVEEKEVNEGQIPLEKSVSVPSIKKEIKAKAEYKYYIVKKNDTLQKISNKFYGTTRKWKLIYKENKDIIKNPNKVYPGIKIKIPQLK